MDYLTPSPWIPSCASIFSLHARLAATKKHYFSNQFRIKQYQFVYPYIELFFVCYKHTKVA